MSDAFLSPGRHHPIWKEWRRIGKGRETRFFLEHRQAVLESLDGAHPPCAVLLSRELHGEDPEGWETLARRRASLPWYLLDGASLDQVASVPSNSGLCALFEPRPATFEALAGGRFLLVAWDVVDPGNLGTLIRIAQALGDGGLLAVGGCQPWASKVARASAGALLQARVARVDLEGGESALGRLRQAGFSLYSAFPRAGRSLSELAWEGKTAVLLGNETRGLPGGLEGSTTPFTIPMASATESLNVAITGAIVSWEWRRCLPEREPPDAYLRDSRSGS